MPDISIDEVERIAKLAKLRFSNEEKHKLQKELSEILNYINQLSEVTDKASLDIDERALNLMREDVAEAAEDPEIFLSQAPAKEGKFVKVKSVLD